MRTGAAPASAASATDITTLRQGARISWDVTGDLDTAAERATDAGWELVDEGSSPPDAVSEIHSAQAQEPDPDSPGQTKKLRIALVYTVPESPTCLEVNPTTLTSTSAGSRSSLPG